MSLPSLLELPTPPLSAEQVTRIDALAVDLSPQALLWASGYLAGLARREVPSPAAAQAQAAPAGVVLEVLFASQTGNGKRLASQFAETCERQGVAARLRSLADFKPRDLATTEALLLVVSTHGDGDPPDDAIGLLRQLARLQPGQLSQMNYVVLALGDSSYPQFCKTGRDFDERLAALGARRVEPRLECDAGLEEASPAWMQALVSKFATILPQAAAANARPQQAGRVEAAPAVGTATVLLNQRLTGRHSSKEVRHVELALDTSRFDYTPGDSLVLTPRNPTSVVAEIIALGAWAADAAVEVGGVELPLELALSEHLEITQVARPVLAALVGAGTNETLKAWLAGASAADITAYVETRQVVDVLRDAAATLTARDFCAALRPLAGRAYSIASSRLATPDEVHLTVSVVAGAHDGLPRPGAASTFLAALAPGAELKVGLERNANFRLPAQPGTDIIMVGPGTGVAPFRAFLEERSAVGAAGRSWLFFGERTEREDFLYQIEWQRHLREGSLTRLDVAFSRDGARREYVQDRLREHGAEVHAWLEGGAVLYVCGDASRMARDVHATLRALFVEFGGLTEEAAEDRLLELREQGRYQRDVY